MRLCGLTTTLPRLRFVRAVAALSSFQGYSHKLSVRFMMAAIVEDDENCGTYDLQSEKLAATTRRFQEELAEMLHSALNP